MHIPQTKGRQPPTEKPPAPTKSPRSVSHRARTSGEPDSRKDSQSTKFVFLRHFEHGLCISDFHLTALCSLHVKTLFTKIDFLGLGIWCTCLHSYFVFAGSGKKDMFLCQCLMHVIFNYVYIL